MESARTDDEMLGTVHGEDEESMTSLVGEEEEVSFRERETAPAPRRARTPANATRSGRGKVDSVTVKEGETLWKLAERPEVYGNGQLYPILYKANKALLPDPNHPKAGTVLKVPRNLPAAEVEIALEESMTGQFLDGSPLPGAQAASPPPPPKPPKPETGLGWLAWVLVLAAAGGGFAAWKRRQKGAMAAGAAPPPAA